MFQSCRDGAIASWVINQYFRGVKCLAQGHNTAAVSNPGPLAPESDTLPLSHCAPLTTMGLMESSPDALLGFRLQSSFVMPETNNSHLWHRLVLAV